MSPTKLYQDRWRDGEVVKPGRRDCEGRYRLILPAIQDARSVIDVGGWDGYFVRRLVEDLGCAGTLVDTRPTDGLGAIEHRRMKVTADNVHTLGSCDVVLALAVLHHMPDWRAVYDRLRALARRIVVEAAHPDEVAEGARLTATLRATRPQIAPVYERVMADGKVLGWTSGPNGVDRPLVLIDNQRAGIVEDGTRRAAPLMADQPAGYWTPLGYEPVPGTLNIRVGEQGRGWVRQLPRPVDLTSDKLPGPYWPVTLIAGRVAVEGHVRCSRSRVAVEAVAPVRLRVALQVGNGDTVTVAPR